MSNTLIAEATEVLKTLFESKDKVYTLSLGGKDFIKRNHIDGFVKNLEAWKEFKVLKASPGRFVIKSNSKSNVLKRIRPELRSWGIKNWVLKDGETSF